jgi:hypothetical protein
VDHAAAKGEGDFMITQEERKHLFELSQMIDVEETIKWINLSPEAQGSGSTYVIRRNMIDAIRWLASVMGREATTKFDLIQAALRARDKAEQKSKC